MDSLFNVILLELAALVAATIASITGFGGAVLLLPVMTLFFSVQEAVPILTIAQLIGNGGRAWYHRGQIDRRVVAWFALGGIPAAVGGSLFFALADTSLLRTGLGYFLVLMVVIRHLPIPTTTKMPLWGFLPVGVLSGFLSALLGSVGPLIAPFFLAYGLLKSAYIGTEAVTAVIVHLTKTIAYSQYAMISTNQVWWGLSLGPVMILGSYLGKQIVDRISEASFVMLIEISLVLAGLRLILQS